MTAVVTLLLSVTSATAFEPEKAVPLTVEPAAAPKPALKYRLLPEVSELNPGNPVQFYLRCFAEQRNFFFGKESSAARAHYLAAPLAMLHVDQLRNYGGSALTQADWAARLDTPDWEVLRRVQNEGVGLILPELGPLQLLAMSLQVRFRGQIAERHFDHACATAKTMFAFARHLGEHPTQAGNLVGISVAHRALDAIQEMLQQPGCPNLYWALTDLPSPLVEVRKGIQGDCSMVAGEFRGLRDDAPMSREQLEELVRRLSGTAGFAREQTGAAPESFRSRLGARVKNEAGVQAARERLTDPSSKDKLGQVSNSIPAILGALVEACGRAELVQKLPPAQVILLDEKREYELRRDEAVKLTSLTPWQIDAITDGQPSKTSWDGLFKDLLPQVVKARRAQARVEQRIALLRHVEALRIYAAQHEGKLPRDLSEIRLPLPVDPFTGKPFEYSVSGTEGHIRGCPARDDDDNANVSYRVTVTR
jgi:hypothetical protein